ncbi:hypothetical protein NC653_034215 [Populus alba x Populus x berolinensis]|uniref:Uncharacterized protein n=1 Tax=Populus alba x Populus x berolinensis TaxID=444605 RepID=A0AAD6PVS8_9ROSI|nr:hypothetical protein NC653_034215 [Populus alba x Populus x berolinensis]
MSPHKYTRAHEERQIEEGVVHIRGDQLPLCQGRKGCSAGCSANGLWGKTSNSSNTSQSQDGSSDLIMGDNSPHSHDHFGIDANVTVTSSLKAGIFS